MKGPLQMFCEGEFVLLYDSKEREDEVDMVVAAERVTPAHIARMRTDAGGLLCMSLENEFAQRLGLRYMHEMLSTVLEGRDREMIMGMAPYGDRPSFSLSVNHTLAYTGVTDRDRSLTIRKLAELHAAPDPREGFVSGFRTPGHVPLLVAAPGLLGERQGHTELSVCLAKLAHMVPAAVICEMMDGKSHRALSVSRAERYAKRHNIPLLDTQELAECMEFEVEDRNSGLRV